MTVRQHVRPPDAEGPELLMSAFHESPAAISILDFDDWKYLAANEAFLRLAGQERDEIIGRTSERVSIWADEEERVRFAETLALQESVTGFETVFRRGSGEIVYGALSAKLIDIKGRAPSSVSTPASGWRWRTSCAALSSVQSSSCSTSRSCKWRTAGSSRSRR